MGSVMVRGGELDVGAVLEGGMEVSERMRM